MERIGFIKLYRSLLNNPVWELEKPFTKGQAWVDLLLLTNYAPGLISTANGTVIDVKRGQCGYSKMALADRWGWSRKKVNSFLNLLEKLGMAQQKNNLKHCIISISNFEKYQEVSITEQQKAQQKSSKRNIKRITTEQQQNNDGTQEKKNKEEKKNKKLLEAKTLFNKVFGEEETFKNYENLKKPFESWLAYKQEINDQYKGEIGIKNAFKKLINISGGDFEKAEEILSNSAANGWRGLYEKKDYNNKKTTNLQKQYNEDNGWKL